MSIAFERSRAHNSAQRSDFGRRMPSFFGDFEGDRRFPPAEEDDDGSSSSSSIGRNSDVSSDGEDSGDDCGGSPVRGFCHGGGPLETMGALEEVLPIKRGISKFYNGKSKSFTSLADATYAPSAKDLAKPENPYTRKRKNLLARNNLLDHKNHNSPPKESSVFTSKKPPQGFAISCPRGNNIKEESESQSRSASPSSSRPPLHPRPKPLVVHGSCSSPPRRNSPWRSFSLSDLRSAAGNYND